VRLSVWQEVQAERNIPGAGSHGGWEDDDIYPVNRSGNPGGFDYRENSMIQY
jgi:hypothetical protein